MGGAGSYGQAGFNGGGNTILPTPHYLGGGGGGGASDCRLTVSDLTSRVVVAGGAGGAAGSSAQKLDSTFSGGNGGGNAGAPGSGFNTSNNVQYTSVGKGGTQVYGGTAGGLGASNGQLGLGGTGAIGAGLVFSGGGGGGMPTCTYRFFLNVQYLCIHIKYIPYYLTIFKLLPIYRSIGTLLW